MKDLYVRRAYTAYGITVVVEIDFVKKTVSLTDKDGKPKDWTFAQRTPEYLNGWRAIMLAMEYAVQQVQKEFAELDEKEHKEFVELWAKLDQQLKKGQGNPDEKPSN